MPESPYLPLYYNSEFIGDLVRDSSGKIHFEANVRSSIDFPKTSAEMLTFLENLLPEGTRQDWYLALRRIKSPDLFGWLKEYGHDPVGCITTGDATENESARDITKQVCDLVGRRQPLDAVFARQKSMLPGADFKMSLLVKDGKFFLPGGNTLTTHILKYGNELCLNETFCLTLMEKCGIEAAVPELLCLNGQEALLTRRFDRKQTPNGIVALDQRDFCQELKILSHFKYSVTHKQIASLSPRLILATTNARPLSDPVPA